MELKTNGYHRKWHNFDKYESFKLCQVSKFSLSTFTLTPKNIARAMLLVVIHWGKNTNQQVSCNIFVGSVEAKFQDFKNC